jgi:hypothetical protein
VSVCSSAMEQIRYHWRIFMKFEYFSKNRPRIFLFHQNLKRIASTLHDDQYTFCITFRSVLLRRRNVSYKSCREKQHTNTHTYYFS